MGDIFDKMLESAVKAVVKEGIKAIFSDDDDNDDAGDDIIGGDAES